MTVESSDRQERAEQGQGIGLTGPYQNACGDPASQMSGQYSAEQKDRDPHNNDDQKHVGHRGKTRNRLPAKR